MRLAPVVALVLLAAMPASAQDSQSDLELDCDQPLSQSDMTACAGLDWEKADAELNEVWLALVATAQFFDAELLEDGSDGRQGHEETLRIAQRAWIDLRDASAISRASRPAAVRWSRCWSISAWRDGRAPAPNSCAS